MAATCVSRHLWSQAPVCAVRRECLCRMSSARCRSTLQILQPNGARACVETKLWLAALKTVAATWPASTDVGLILCHRNAPDILWEEMMWLFCGRKGGVSDSWKEAARQGRKASCSSPIRLRSELAIVQRISC